MRQPSDFAERVATRAPSMAPVSRRIAEHLLRARPEVVLQSAAELAAELGTSDASIIRTAKALGYQGLDELRRAIASASSEPSLEERLRRSLAQNDDAGSALDFVAGHHVAALDGVVRRIRPPMLQAAVDVLARAERMLWSGTGPSAAMAEYGASLAARLGRPGAVLRGSGAQQADDLLAIGARDAVVLFAYGRVNARVRALVERCEAVGAAVVLITDAVPKELGGRVATVLPCGRGTPGLFSSHGTTLILIEALILGLAAADPERAEASLALLNDLRASVAGRRSDVYLA